ncbi:MAG: FtsX-like permease family protein, partial [Pseudomonadota bacterium]
MQLQIALALRYLSGRKLRTFLTTLAVVFGVVVIFGMNIVIPTMLQAFQANVMAASGMIDVTITHRTGSAFSPQVVNELNGIDGVRAVAMSLNRTVNLPANYVDHNPDRPDRITAVALVGVDPQAVQALRAYLIQDGGRFLQADDTDATVISQSLADAYGVGLGGKITILSVNGNVALTVVGILPTRTTPGNEEVLVTLAQAQTMTGQPGQINTIEINLDAVDETRRNEIVANIQSALGDNYQVGSLQSGSEMFAAIEMGQAALNLFGLLALFMGGFIIFNTFRTVVTERRRDIGMLRAIGAKRGTITGMILVEGLLQGLLGSAVGILLGYLFGAGVMRLASAPLSAFVHLKVGAPVVSPALLIISVVLGVGVTILAGLLPAISASKVTPMDALRPSVAEVEFKRRIGAGFTAGVILIVLSILALTSKNMGLVGLGNILFLIGLILLAPALLRPITSVLGKLT